MSDPVNSHDAAGTVTPRTRELIGQAAPWLRFLSVLGSVFYGLMGVFLVFVVALALVNGGLLPNLSQLLTTALIFFLVLAVFYPSLVYLGRLAKFSKRYRHQGEPADLEAALRAVKSLAKFYGLFFALYVVLALGLMAFGGASLFRFGQ